MSLQLISVFARKERQNSVCSDDDAQETLAHSGSEGSDCILPTVMLQYFVSHVRQHPSRAPKSVPTPQAAPQQRGARPKHTARGTHAGGQTKKKTLHKLWMHLYLWPYILRGMKRPLYTLAAGAPVLTPVCVLHPLCSGVTNAFLPASSRCQHCLEVSFHWATGTTAPSRLCLLS